jgi:tRNA(Ile2) C34 agmatinyltransferase TiaS
MEEAIRILEAAKERNIEWMKRLPEGAKQTYLEKNKVIDKAVKKLIIADVVVPKGTLSCDCPVCSKKMTSQLVKHHHCKECKEHYTTT